MLDILIKDATIVDGTGKPPYKDNVGIMGSKIKVKQVEATAKRVIDGKGLHVSPGFIDCHSHGDQVLGQKQAALSKVSQGITTEITGQCGGSMFPITPENLKLAQGLLSIGTHIFPDDMVNWTTFNRYYEYARTVPLETNIKVFTGHTTLRIAVMGYANRRPTSEEMDKMKTLVLEAMENGSMGLSSGLLYPPGCYADTDELVELATVVKPYGGMYATHIRNESDNIIDAVKEALEIGRRADVPVCISHHKICGKQNWGLSAKTLQLIENAIDDGIEVTVDQYPYTANMTHLNICIPPWYFKNKGITGMIDCLKDPETRKRIRADMENPDSDYDNFYVNAGGFDGIFISGCPNTTEADGLFVSEYAEKIDKDPFDAYFDLLIENEGKANAVYHSICSEDLIRIIRNPNTVIGTDGTCRSMEEPTHPRTFGSFPKAIRYYVKEKEILTLEEIIRKMTSLAAERMTLKNKGVIADGYDADLVVFNYENLKDMADYTHSTRLCEGIEYVFVNGKLVYHDKQLTGETPGKFIKHNA